MTKYILAILSSLFLACNGVHEQPSDYIEGNSSLIAKKTPLIQLSKIILKNRNAVRIVSPSQLSIFKTSSLVKNNLSSVDSSSEDDLEDNGMN